MELFQQFKVCWTDNKSGIVTGKGEQKTGGPTAKDTDRTADQHKEPENEDDVGDEDNTQGFGIGRAHPNSRPKVEEE